MPDSSTPDVFSLADRVQCASARTAVDNGGSQTSRPHRSQRQPWRNYMGIEGHAPIGTWGTCVSPISDNGPTIDKVTIR